MIVCVRPSKRLPRRLAAHRSRIDGRQAAWGSGLNFIVTVLVAWPFKVGGTRFRPLQRQPPPLRNRSHCPSRSKILHRRAVQSSNAIARQRQSPAQSMSDRALFDRSCEYLPKKHLFRWSSPVLSYYELTHHKLTTHNMYREKWLRSQCPT
jgi:hypothetical protein